MSATTKTRKKQYAMVVDAAKCIDCKGCMASCKVANDVPRGFWRNWIKQSEASYAQGPASGRQFQPGGCMHCSEPTCVTACPTGATYRDEADGIVKIDRGLCIGCGSCIPACPYGARYRHPRLNVADKCNYCPERRAAGLAPACVDTCPTKARVFGDINDPGSEAAILLAENKDRTVRVVNAQSDTKPNMYYVGGTSPADWPARAQIPMPLTTMMRAATPALQGLIGLTALGVVGLAIKQLLLRQHPAEEQDEACDIPDASSKDGRGED
jgi:tetrathionate reductase subunit B